MIHKDSLNFYKGVIDIKDILALTNTVLAGIPYGLKTSFPDNPLIKQPITIIGFQINISREQLAFDNSYQRKEMHKELTIIKNKIIVAIEEYTMRVCYPGWCIGWKDTIEDSLKALNEAIKEERRKINNISIEE